MKPVSEIVQENCFIDCKNIESLINLMPIIGKKLKPCWEGILEGIERKKPMILLVNKNITIVDYGRYGNLYPFAVYNIDEIDFNN